jgi:hypothetical protein
MAQLSCHGAILSPILAEEGTSSHAPRGRGSYSSDKPNSAQQSWQNVRSLARGRLIHHAGDKPVHDPKDVRSSFGAPELEHGNRCYKEI